MPEKGSIDTESVMGKLRVWLDAHPDDWTRPNEVAKEIGCTTQRAGVYLAKLYQRGDVLRRTTIAPGKSKGISEYRRTRALS